jgi:hypothetical protein
MGVKDFTKVFEPLREIKYKDFAGKTVVIDGSIEIYRAALGMSGPNQLTDKSGNPSSHINTILIGVILKLKASGADQYWIFDHDHVNEDGERTCHNPLKELELQKRKEKKTAAKTKIDELNAKLDSVTIRSKPRNDDSDVELFSDIESFSDGDNNQDQIDKIKQDIAKQEKVAFNLEKFYKEDVIFMLNMLDIPWIVCPPGFEAEQLAAITTYTKIFDKKIDYVFTPDSDALLFGACRLIKRDIRKKKLYEYNLAGLLHDYNIKQIDLIKIGLILGTDFATKTAGIGPKTVLKKFNTVELSDEQILARDNVFMRKITSSEINSIVINNKGLNAFENIDKYNQLLEWLDLVKSYNKDRIDKQFRKAGLFVKPV